MTDQPIVVSLVESSSEDEDNDIVPALTPSQRVSRNQRPTFLICHCASHKEFSRLCQIVRNLGGQTLDKNSPYNARADVCILGSLCTRLAPTSTQMPKTWRVLGFLMAGKPLLNSTYLEDCDKAGRFLDNLKSHHTLFFPHAREFVKRNGGKMLKDWRIVVLITDERKSKEIKEVVRDAGATVVQYSPASLLKATSAELATLTMIISEPELCDVNMNFKLFVGQNETANPKVRIYSYFYLLKFATDPRPEHRARLEYFKLNNPRLREILHPRKKGRLNQNLSGFFPNNQRVQEAIERLNANSGRNLTNDDRSFKANDRTPFYSQTSKRQRLYQGHIQEVITIDDESEKDVRIVSEKLKHTRSINRRAPSKKPQKDVKMDKPPVIDLCDSDNDVDDDIEVINERRKELVIVLESSSDSEPSEDETAIEKDVQISITGSSKRPASSIGEPNLIYCDKNDKSAVNMPEEKSSISSEPSLGDITMNNNQSASQPDQILSLEVTEPSTVEKEKYSKGDKSLDDADECFSPNASYYDNSAKSSQKEFHQVFENETDLEIILGRFFSTLVRRQKLSNECIDIEDAKVRTFRFDSKHESDASQVISEKITHRLDDTESYMTYGVCREDDSDEIISGLQNLKLFIDSRTFPGSETLHSVMNSCIVEGKNQLVIDKAHELFRHVLFLHPPVSRKSRLYYLSVFRKHYDQELTSQFDLASSNSFSQFFLDLVSRRVKNAQEKGCEFAIDIIVSVMQKDLEFWWKHGRTSKCKDENLLILALVERDSRIDFFITQLLDILDDTLFENFDFVWKIIAMCGLLSSALDSEMNQTSLDNEQSCKARLAHSIHSHFQSLRNNPDRLFTTLSMVRPSWLKLCVSKRLLNKKHTSYSALEDIVQINNASGQDEAVNEIDLILKSLSLDSCLDTYNFHLMQSVIENGSRTCFKGLNNLEKQIKTPPFKLDSKISVSMESAKENIGFLKALRNKDCKQITLHKTLSSKLLF